MPDPSLERFEWTPEGRAILMEAGADMNAKNRYSRTPLHLSASGTEVARARIEWSDECVDSGWTPLRFTPLHLAPEWTPGDRADREGADEC